MKVLALFDRHREFAPSDSVPGLESDAVILAGDIHSPAKDALEWAANRFGGKPFAHTHGNADYQIGTCRRMCNPRGYPNRSLSQQGAFENRGSHPRLVFDV